MPCDLRRFSVCLVGTGSIPGLCEFTVFPSSPVQWFFPQGCTGMCCSALRGYLSGTILHLRFPSLAYDVKFLSIQGSSRSYLFYYSSLKVHCSSLSYIQCLQTYLLIYFVLLKFIIGRRLNMAPVTSF